MNINREFSANASRPSAKEVELFFDIEENSLAYIDHNRIKRLVSAEGRDAPSSTILCRLDLSENPSMLIVENPLPQDFKFKIANTGAGVWTIQNGAGTIFADPSKCRVNIDTYNELGNNGRVKLFNPMINLNTPDSGTDTNILTVKFADDRGNAVTGSFISWLEITVFNIKGRRLQRELK
jgi:hypothetical protein